MLAITTYPFFAGQLRTLDGVSLGSGVVHQIGPAGGIGLTPQEQQLLTQLAQRVNQTRLQEKDPDAENLLGRELSTNPDAIYILAQTVLVQDIALQQASAQVAQLQQQVQQTPQQQQPAHSTSFLGRLLGEREPQPAPPPQQSQQQPPFQPVQYAPQAPAQLGAPQYAGQQYAPPMYAAPAGQPNFLRSAAQTAAGVAAGALAFEGIESLLHGFGHGGGWGPGAGLAGFGVSPGIGMGGAYERPIEETVVNNYYDQPGPLGSGESRIESAGGEHHAHDAGGDLGGAQFADTSNTSGADDFGSFDRGTGANRDDLAVSEDNSLDNYQIDDSGSDDMGSFDDGGGGFDNSSDDGGF